MKEWEFAKQLKDEELIATLTRCVKEDRDVTARLLVHLGEVDARGLFRELGFSSMFDYAVQALHMSESEAGLRLRAARLGREFPSALTMVARGELHMTALKLLAPVLTPSSLDLLDQARFKSKLEIQKLIAARFPQPDVASVIRKLPAPRPASTPASSAGAPCAELASHATHPGRTAKGLDAKQGTLGVVESAAPTQPDHSSLSATAPAAPTDCGALPAVAIADPVRPHAAVSGPDAARPNGSSLRAPAASAIVPLSPGRYKVQFTASQSLVDLFDEARDLLQAPTQNADLPSIVERALALLVAERKKQRFALTRKSRAQGLSVSDAAADDKTGQTPGPTVRGVRGEPHAATRIARDEPCAATRIVRDEPHAATRIVRDEPHAATRIVRDEPHAATRIVRDEPGASTRTVRDEPDASTRMVRDEPDASTRMVRDELEAPTLNTRHIPHAVRRQVYARDAGRCCFVSSEGTRCRARGRLEFHHIVPFARGGEATLDNICLMCRSHNALVAEQDYGREFVKRRRTERRAAPHERLHDAGGSRHDGDGSEPRTTPRAFASATRESTPTIQQGPDPA